MRRWTSVLAVLCSVGALPGESSERERFELYTGCSKVGFDAYADAPYKQRIATFGEARLRGARLFDQDAGPFLSVSVVTLDNKLASGRKIGAVMSWVLDFEKLLFDRYASGETRFATTWRRTGVATTGRDIDESYLVDILEAALDEFIADYLRVNENACTEGPG